MPISRNSAWFGIDEHERVRHVAGLLERLRPDLWVKGGDYGPLELPEAPLVRRHGGQVLLLPYLEGRSTTRLVRRAHTAGGEHR